jgi:histidyl-tRNA synthetase
MKVQRCKGTQDLSPAEMRKFRFIEGIFRDCCLKWGYDEVRTPTLEYLHLFTSTGTLTPGRLGRVYSFLDWDGWSGERVVLRPDGTIPIARLYIDEMEEEKLARLFYVTNVFTFEETGKETREKWQCGAELIGAGSAVADIEMAVLALDVLKKAGLKNVELRLSHAGLIRALLAEFGLDSEEQGKLFDQILDGDERVLSRIKAEKPELGRTLSPLLEMKGKSSGFLKNLKALFNHDLPELAPALDNFVEVVDRLDEVGIKYRIDIASGRGFEYYTGVMYQLMAGKEHVGGGGRYDALIPLMGGKDIPASGFALYLDRLMNMVKAENPDGSPTGAVMVKAGSGEGALKEAFNLAGRLHDAGYRAEIYLGGTEPAGVRWQVDVGEAGRDFAVTDRTGSGRRKAATAEDVIKLLKH